MYYYTKAQSQHGDLPHSEMSIQREFLVGTRHTGVSPHVIL